MYNLLTAVNKEEILSHEGLFLLFSKANYLIRECIRAIVAETLSIQFDFIDLGASVAARIDYSYNKNIYKRGVQFKEDKIVDVPKNLEAQTDQYLCHCMDLQLAIAKEDTKKQLDIVDNLRISRIILERFVYSWVYPVLDYIIYTQQYLNAYTNDDTDAKQQALRNMVAIEQKYNINPESGNRLVKFVQSRMHAVSLIYERIHNAYTRVTLNVARSNAVTSDYISDNYQEGSFGLIEAISSYDYLTNARFSGYAKWSIRQKIVFSLKDKANTIKLKSNMWDHFAKLERIKGKCEALEGNVTTERLSQKSGYTVSHIDSIYNNIKTSQVSSLDYPLNDDGFTLLHIQEDDIDIERTKNLSLLVSKLTPQLRKLVCLRFGFTIKQDIDEEEVEKEKIRQVVAKILSL